MKVESMQRPEIKEQTSLLTLLHYDGTASWKSAVMSEIYIDISNFFDTCPRSRLYDSQASWSES